MIIPLVAFLSGACVMAVEMVGARIIAPYAGNTIHSWTAIISVILACLSMGYLIGGRLADRYPSKTVLSFLFFLSALAVSLIKTMEWVLLPITIAITDVRMLAVVLSLGMFLVPSMLLGMISPFALRLSLHSVAGSGRTAGMMTALSTLGSITGTVVTGFFLLGTIGHTAVLMIVIAILIGCGVLLWWNEKRHPIGMLMLVLFPAIWIYQTRIIQHPLGTEQETAYNRVFVQDGTEPNSGRPVRMLSFDLHGIQSAMYLDRDDDLVSAYTKQFRIVDAYLPTMKRALIIGGAGYDYPKDFLRRYLSAEIRVVEVDEGITAIAREQFFVPNDQRLSIVHADGRIALKRDQQQYDAIYMDAFSALVTPPFHLMTTEMMEIVRDRLQPEGVFLMNSIASFDSKLFRSMYATLNSQFSTIHIYRVDPERSLTEPQNIVFVAMKREREPQVIQADIVSLVNKRYSGEVPAGVVFTDEFAPVEQYAMELLK